MAGDPKGGSIVAQAGSVLAAFPGPDVAKAAMAALERAGVPHSDVRLLADGAERTRSATARGDDRIVGWLGGRWVRGALVGAVVGLVVFLGALVLVWDGSLYPAWIGTAVGGAAAGAFVGGFVWVGLRMPRNPQAWDTYRLAHRDEACVAVRLRRAGADQRVSELLGRAGATAIEVVGDDGGRRAADAD